MIANNVGAGVLVAIVGAGALVAIATAVWFKWIEARHGRAFAEQGERLNAGCGTLRGSGQRRRTPLENER